MKNTLSQGRYSSAIASHNFSSRRLAWGRVAGLAIAMFLALGVPAQARASRILADSSVSTPEAAPIELDCVPQGEKFLCEPTDQEAEAAIAASEAATGETTTPIKATTTSSYLTDIHRIQTANIALGLAVILGGGLGLSLLASRRDRLDEDADLQQQIEFLERIWQKSPSA